MMTLEPHLTGFIFFTVLGGLVLLWLAQIIIIWLKIPKRKYLKSALQTLLFASLILFLLQPAWDKSQSGNGYLVFPEGFSPSLLQCIQDSLSVSRTSLPDNLPKENVDEIYLLGQDYSLAELLGLPHTKIQWIPHFKENQISAISWEGIISYGQMQTIKGRIHATQGASIQLLEFGRIKDEFIVGKQGGEFGFEFPALVLGQNELTLKINEEEVADIRFFVNPAIPVNYQLLFGFPNTEGRVLTDYLVKRGDKAGTSYQLSKVGRIMAGGLNEEQRPEVLMLDPSQLDKKTVIDALQVGNSSILVLNLQEVEKEILGINQQFKTNFKLRKVADELRETENGAMAAPFVFEQGPKQQVFNEGSVCITYSQGNKIAVSLLESTFHIALSGDSLKYAGIWEKILAAVSPPQKEKMAIKMPVFTQFESEIELSTEDSIAAFVRLETDSLCLLKNPVNKFKFKTIWIPDSAGWTTLDDEARIYAYGKRELEDLRHIVQMKLFLKDRGGDVDQFAAKQKIPDWGWLILLLLCFTLVWIEPRFT